MSFKVKQLKGVVKETVAKAYKPKKVKSQFNKPITKIEENEDKYDLTSFDKEVKTHTNSIQSLLNVCDSSVNSIINSKQATTFIAKANSLWIVFKDRTKLKIEYLNQPKVKVDKEKVKYTLMDSHNRILA